jgi:conjugative relaxase-like TrwC/TraI family protein
MLRVTTIYASSAGSAAAYYTKYLADAPGEAPGVWAGRQAARLGLAGDVSAVDLETVLEGRDPRSGMLLGQHLADRALADGRVVRAVAGFDATFSAPKSVSVLWALTGDDRLLAAHDTAVAAALAHLERYGATTRVRAGGGRLHPDTVGLTMATFRQSTSRADDPQVHTHVVISAKVQTGEGRWLALDARYLKRYQRMLGGLYQSVLRNELTHHLGVAWGDIEHGQAELAGIPDGLREGFSKRSAQVVEAVVDKRAEFVERQGREPNRWELAALTREAAADTRTAKSHRAVTDLTARWTAEAAALGWTGPALAAAVVDAGRDQPDRPLSLGFGEVVAALSAGGSTWNRADVVAVVCDLARPHPSLDGRAWARVVEAVADEVIARCVELDPPPTTGGPRRRGDGRSLWLEPTAPHLTTDAILREEQAVLTWAGDAQVGEPSPSATVDTSGLDVLQAGAAAAVAGQDRLVLVVGPAGTGKTTTLRAAVTDLHQQERVVFGVAPSAKAARVLERETGVPSDTLAKLCHDWQRSDRPPAPRYRLPAGATVVVDEAGMLPTPALAHLTTLATTQGWRLALIGDPHQLQAVGRGGLFGELCQTGPVHELQRIHRFTARWEAAASRRLRHGDPAGWGPYLDHGRVIAGTFEEHLATAAHRWLTTTATGATVSVVAGTNDHVDALNATIQEVRVACGQLDPTTSAPIGGGEEVMVGDHIVTRRNDRTLTTSTGEPVRNRETWTVTAIGHDGTLTATSHHDHGHVALPPDYVREHVRLGYAATEHGVQGDTTSIGIALVSAATTRRGVYVAVTRGRDDNTILVVTPSHDLDDARDALERITTLDRADIPATTQRRSLATALPDDACRPAPRWEIPNWLPDLRATITKELAALEARRAHARSALADLPAWLADAEAHLERAERRLDPHRPAIDQAAADVASAQERVWATYSRSLHLKGRHRRAADREHHVAELVLAAARQREAHARTVAEPATGARDTAARHAHDLRHQITTAHTVLDGTAAPDQLQTLRALGVALHDWERWATGTPITPAHLASMLDTLHTGIAAGRPECAALASVVEHWAHTHGLDLPQVARAAPVERSPGMELDIDL